MNAKFILYIYFVTFLITLSLSTFIHVFFITNETGTPNIALIEFAQATIDMSEIIFGAFVGALSVSLKTSFDKDDKKPAQ